VFDLLNARKRLNILEDGKKQVCNQSCVQAAALVMSARKAAVMWVLWS
jgi:hypothetical protein